MKKTCPFVIGSPSFHGVSGAVVGGVNVVSKLSIVLSSLGSTPTVSNNGDGSGKLDPPTTPEYKVWKEGDPITKRQVKFILKNWDKDKKDPDEFYIRAMINAAYAQNIFTSASLVDTAVRKVTSGGSGLDIIQILFSPKIPIVSS